MIHSHLGYEGLPIATAYMHEHALYMYMYMYCMYIVKYMHMILDIVINNGCIFYVPYYICTCKCTGTVSLPHISNIMSLVGQLDTTPVSIII